MTKELEITREKLDARRCGLATGPGPAWKWGYRLKTEGVEIIGLGHDLASLRSIAARRMVGSTEPVTLKEDWSGGKRFVLGSRGGWNEKKDEEGK